MNTGPTADTAATPIPITMASMANSSELSEESASITNASAMPATPPISTSRWAEYLSAKDPIAGASSAPSAMMAMTTPAAEASPAISFTYGGMSSDTNALYPAPIAKFDSIHHSKVLACRVTTRP